MIRFTRKTSATIALLALLVLVIGVACYDLTRSPQRTATAPQPKNTHLLGAAPKASGSPLATVPQPAAASAPRVLFSDPLNGPDRIVTNENSHWSKRSCSYLSDKWDITSGTLMVKDNAGYSGVPTSESSSVCQSAKANNSAIFRLNTKNFSFGDTVTSMDFMLAQHGGGGAPDNSYDGLHLWVRYQSQYALYSVTVSRWDGTIDIKKKVPLGVARCASPANDGCYYDLVKQIKRPDLAQGKKWHHADVIATDDADGKVHISLEIDGSVVLSATDNAVGPAYHNGAVGVRGDNTEFYFKNFTVTSD